MDLTLRTAAPVNTAVSGNKKESAPLTGTLELPGNIQQTAGFSGISAALSLRGAPGKQLDFSQQAEIKTPPNLAGKAEVNVGDSTQTASAPETIQQPDLIQSANNEPSPDLLQPANNEPSSDLIQPANSDPLFDSTQSANNDPSLDFIQSVNSGPSSDFIAPVNVPADLLAQVEQFTLSSQRTLLPTLSLFTDTPKTNSDSNRLGDVIHLSNADSLPLKKVISSSFLGIDPAQKNTSPLQGINAAANGLTEKTIEWAKVDLHAELKLSDSKAAASSRIGEKLIAILQDRINIQASNNIKSAQIRLDPPDLGHIKLTVAIEGDKVSIGIVSHNSVVREGLLQTSERLRHELVNQNFVNVSVDISSGSEGQANKQQNSGEQVLANTFTAADEHSGDHQNEFIAKV
ncbi:MAG: flagellar hook-length control protein FliK [Psychromonas sp.]|jgi:flagellar hook-length control protein FliK|uniref:flagellar hook-length control protein FliK n=1 Tax=Psychromonas sp. TaxID=1884585 RepID=UPI0039E3F8E5